MKICPYCSNDVPDSARLCSMCGTGLPPNLPRQHRRVLPLVIAITLVGSLAAAAFLFGAWQADVTPIPTAPPAVAPAPAGPRPVKAQPAEPADTAAPAAVSSGGPPRSGR